MKNKKRKGFTLIELLATIIVISIVFGIGYTIFGNVINNSRTNAIALSSKSIRTAARLYVEENKEDVYWNEESGNNNKNTCVYVGTLVDSGYLKEKQVEDHIDDSVYLVKNSSGTIISDNLDIAGEDSKCEDASDIRKVTPKDFCNSFEYEEVKGKNYTANDFCILKTDANECYYEIDEEMKFNGNVTKTITNAGLYTLTIHDRNDNNLTKQIQCRVKKSQAALTIDPPASASTKIGETTYATIYSNIDGKVTVKSSNKIYVQGQIIKLEDMPVTTDNNAEGQEDALFENTEPEEGETTEPPENNEEGSENTTDEQEEDEVLEPKYGLKIKTLAGKDTTSYLSVTLEPNDEYKKNYSASTFAYTINKTGEAEACLPTPEEYCKIITKSETKDQVITNMPSSYDGFTFSNYIVYKNEFGRNCEGDDTDDDIAEDIIGKQCIKAKLKYGYVWSNCGDMNDEELNKYNNSTKNYHFYCPIMDEGAPKVYVKYNMNGGKLSKEKGDKITSNQKGNILCDGSDYCGIYEINDTEIDLYNWDNPNYINIEKEGYHAKEGAEWKVRLPDKTWKYFSDSELIKATDLCDTSEGSCIATLRVNWVHDDCIYKFDGNGETSGSMKDKGCSKEEPCILPANGFVKDGYGFIKWTEKDDGTGISYEDGETITNICEGTQKLYANWGDATYTVKFDCNGGTGSMQDISCVAGSNCKLPNNTCSKTGHSFSKWIDAANSTKTYSNAAVVKDIGKPSSTVTLKANYTPNNYYVDLNGTLDGKAIGNITGYGKADVYINNTKVATGVTDYYKAHPYGSTYKIVGVAVDGHNGGGTINGVIGAKNVDARLRYNTNVCTINYNANGGKFTDKANKGKTTQTLKYGQSIGNMRNPVGYYGAKRTNYSVTNSKAWILSYNNKKYKYDQAKGYAATSICHNLTKANQTVNLYVNWWRYKYKKCSKGKVCAAAGCASSKTSCQTCTAGGQTAQWCYTKPNHKWWQTSQSTKSHSGTCQYSCNCKTTCTSYKSSASACGCSSWPSKWSTSSCSGNSNACQKKQFFVIEQ